MKIKIIYLVIYTEVFCVCFYLFYYLNCLKLTIEIIEDYLTQCYIST